MLVNVSSSPLLDQHYPLIISFHQTFGLHLLISILRTYPSFAGFVCGAFGKDFSRIGNFKYTRPQHGVCLTNQYLMWMEMRTSKNLREKGMYFVLYLSKNCNRTLFYCHTWTKIKLQMNMFFLFFYQAPGLGL